MKRSIPTRPRMIQCMYAQACMMSVDAGACMSIYSHSPTHHVAHVATACRLLTCKLQHHCQQPFNAMSCRHVHMRQNQTSNVYHILRQWTRHNAETQGLNSTASCAGNSNTYQMHLLRYADALLVAESAALMQAFLQALCSATAS